MEFEWIINGILISTVVIPIVIKIYRFITAKRGGKIEYIIESTESKTAIIFSNCIIMLVPWGYFSYNFIIMDNFEKQQFFLGIIFNILFLVNGVVDAFTTIQIRENGIVTKNRFVEWKRIKSIKEGEDSWNVKYLELTIANAVFYKNIKIRKHMFKVTEDIKVDLERKIKG